MLEWVGSSPCNETLKSLIETRKTQPDRVFLVSVELKSRDNWETRDSLDELAQLAATAGGVVVGEGDVAPRLVAELFRLARRSLINLESFGGTTRAVAVMA